MYTFAQVWGNIEHHNIYDGINYHMMPLKRSFTAETLKQHKLLEQ